MSAEIKKSEFKSINFQKASLPIFSEVLQRYPWVYYGENNLLYSIKKSMSTIAFLMFLKL